MQMFHSDNLKVNLTFFSKWKPQCFVWWFVIFQINRLPIRMAAQSKTKENMLDFTFSRTRLFSSAASICGKPDKRNIFVWNWNRFFLWLIIKHSDQNKNYQMDGVAILLSFRTKFDDSNWLDLDSKSHCCSLASIIYCMLQHLTTVKCQCAAIWTKRQTIQT